VNYVYIPYTVQAWKDDVCLFETDCELKVSYDLPDGRSGVIDWDITGFFFDACGTEPGKRVYTEIHPHEPLFHVLKKDLDLDYIDERLRETLADHGEVDLYAEPFNG
jgi:hypothetical protein